MIRLSGGRGYRGSYESGERKQAKKIEKNKMNKRRKVKGRYTNCASGVSDAAVKAANGLATERPRGEPRRLCG